MLDLLQKGGVVLWVIIALSVFAAFLIIERYLYFRRIKIDEEKFFNRLKSSIKKGFYNEALTICDSVVSPFSNMMKVAIEHRNYPEYIQREVIKDAANQEVPQLEKNLSSIGTIAHISPLLGLLGTVTGNIEAFGVLGSVGSVNDPSILAMGISEALLTTAAGLIVSIPTVIFYNLLVRKSNMTVTKLENQVNEIILILRSEEPQKTAPASSQTARSSSQSRPANGAQSASSAQRRSVEGFRKPEEHLRQPPEVRK